MCLLLFSFVCYLNITIFPRGIVIDEVGWDMWVRHQVLDVRKMWKIHLGKTHGNGSRGKRKGCQGWIRGQTSKNRYVILDVEYFTNI